MTDSPHHLYLRAHHQTALIAVGIILTADVAYAAGREVVMPAVGGQVSIPLGLQAPIIGVAVIVGALSGRLHPQEAVAGSNFRRTETGFLVATSCAALLLVMTTATVFANLVTGLVLARATLIWLALAIVGGRVFGWTQAWVLPLAAFFPLNYFATDQHGAYHWWYWPRQPPAALGCALLTIVFLLLAATAYSLTPWRLSQMRTRFQHADHTPES